MNSDRAIRVALASSSRLFLEGIRRILEDEGGIEVIVEASDYEGVKKCFTEVNLEFLLADSRAFWINIYELLSLIAECGSYTKIILFEGQIKGELNYPNVIYITKKTNSSELIQIIKRLNRKLITEKDTQVINSTRPTLTKREIEIVGLVSNGFGNKEMANRLLLSEKTVKSHFSNIFAKLQLQNRYQLMAYGRRLKHS